jgi:hypothetical protein
MRKILTLPVKAAQFNVAEYAKKLPKPHPNIIPEPVIESRSKLFDPEILPVPKRRKMRKCHSVESTGLALPELRQGELNRPDKSEQRNNLTFNWG